MQLIRHADPDTLAEALAGEIDAVLDVALREREGAWLALAGGRTSPPVFRRLAARPREWSRVLAVPSDERWVAHDHPDCNLRQLRAAFAAAPDLRTLALTPAQPVGAADASLAEAALAAHPEPFDLSLLGMGADGHFASLFPGAPTLAAGLDLGTRHSAVAILPDPMPSAGPHPRISLTLARLIRSRRVLLAISGADKLAVLERAQAQGAASSLPVAALLAAPVEVLVHWSP